MTKEERDNLILRMKLDSQRVTMFDQLTRRKQALKGVCSEIDELAYLQYVGRDKSKIEIIGGDELNKKIKDAIIKVIEEEIVLVVKEIENL